MSILPTDNQDVLKTLGFDPAAQRRQALLKGLIGLGLGLASAQRGQGLIGAAQGFSTGVDQGGQDYKSQWLENLKMKSLADDQAAQQAQADALKGLIPDASSAATLSLPADLGMATGTGAGGANKISGGRTGPGGAPTGTTPMISAAVSPEDDQFSDLSPAVRAAAISHYKMRDYAGAQKIIDDFRLNPAKPLVVGQGDVAVDPVTGKTIYSNPKQFTPNIQTIYRGNMQQSGYYDQNMKWVPQSEWAPRWQPQQPTPYSPVNFRFPDGHFQTFDARDKASIDKAVAAGAVQQNPPAADQWKPNIIERKITSDTTQYGYWNQRMQWVPTADPIKSGGGQFSPVNLKFPDGHYQTFDANKPAEIDAAIQAGAVQQNPPSAQNPPQTIDTLTIKFPDGTLQGFANTDIDGVKKALQAGGTQIPSSAVNITIPGQPTIGTVPPGYQAKQAPDGSWSMSKIPGGPADVEQQTAANKANAATAQKQTAATIVTQDIDRAIEKINSAPAWTTGFLGDWLSNVGGTMANDVRALIQTVKANAGFDKLQAMRDASPTGGALGNVSEFEVKTLQSAIGNLEQSQSKEQLVENLRRVQQIYRQIVDGPSAESSSPMPNGPGAPANPNDPLGLFQ